MRTKFDGTWARAAVAAVAAAVLAAGCDRGASLSEIEAKERASRLYTNAMGDLQAGRVDAAIRGFEHVLVQEPGNSSAHFQLATLLQDIRKDYIGAISHYRSYLMFRPASDKATVASDRMKLCDTLLSAEYLRKAGGNATGKLSAENEKLTAARDDLSAKAARLEAQLAEARRQIEKLTRENAKRASIIARLGAEDEGGARRTDASAKEALAELRAMEAEDARRRLNPTDAELLDDDGAAAEDRIKNSIDIKSLRAELDREDAATPSRPFATTRPARSDAKSADKTTGPFDALLSGGKPKKTDGAGGRPKTYTVQAGDTLFKISTRFYGNSHKWRAIRDANKALVPPDGRVRAGQVLTLP